MTNVASFANGPERVISRATGALVASERVPQRGFFGVSALLVAASAAVTIFWCTSMSAVAGQVCF